MARSAESFVVESDLRACLAVSYSADWVHSAVMRKSVGISNKSNSSLERGERSNKVEQLRLDGDCWQGWFSDIYMNWRGLVMYLCCQEGSVLQG